MILAFNVHLVAEIKNQYHILHVTSAIPITGIECRRNPIHIEEKTCTRKMTAVLFTRHNTVNLKQVSI